MPIDSELEKTTILILCQFYDENGFCKVISYILSSFYTFVGLIIISINIFKHLISAQWGEPYSFIDCPSNGIDLPRRGVRLSLL